PNQPDFPGAEFTFNSDDAFYLPELPHKIIVQGGGYIGVEFASIFNGLGCDVELLYRGPKFLKGFDEEVRDFVAEALRKSGVTLSFNADINRIVKQQDKLFVECNDGQTRKAEAVFTAIGRTPRTNNLGLENTCVQL